MKIKNFILGACEAPFILAVFFLVLKFPGPGQDDDKFWLIASLIATFVTASIISNNAHKYILREWRIPAIDRTVECIGGFIALLAIALVFFLQAA